MLKRAFDVAPAEPWRRFTWNKRPLFVRKDERQGPGCIIRSLILQEGGGKTFLCPGNPYGGSCKGPDRAGPEVILDDLVNPNFFRGVGKENGLGVQIRFPGILLQIKHQLRNLPGGNRFFSSRRGSFWERFAICQILPP